MISAALVRACATLRAANWSKSNFCLDMFRSRRLRNISDASSESETRSTIASASNPHLEIEQFAAQGRIADHSSTWQLTIASVSPATSGVDVIFVNTSAFSGTDSLNLLAAAVTG